MRISDWSSDVCSSDLNGSKAGSVGIGIEGRKVRVSPVIGGTTTVGNEETLYMLGVTYQVATGILTFAGAGHETVDPDGSGSDNKQTFGTVGIRLDFRSEEHTSELQSLMRISYAVFCLKKKQTTNRKQYNMSKY